MTTVQCREAIRDYRSDQDEDSAVLRRQGNRHGWSGLSADAHNQGHVDESPHRPGFLGFCLTFVLLVLIAP